MDDPKSRRKRRAAKWGAGVVGAAFLVGYISTSRTVSTQLEAASAAVSHATLSAQSEDEGVSVRTAFLLDDIDSVPDSVADFIAAGGVRAVGGDVLVVPSTVDGLDISLYNDYTKVHPQPTMNHQLSPPPPPPPSPSPSPSPSPLPLPPPPRTSTRHHKRSPRGLPIPATNRRTHPLTPPRLP